MTRPESRRTAPALLVLAVVAAAWTTSGVRPEAKTDIAVDYDKAFSFAGLRTWDWHPDGAGEVKLAISAEDDPQRVAARVDPIIVPAVERELSAKGFTRSREGADLTVHYYVLGTIGQSAQVQGQFVAPVPEWGLPPFTASTTALKVYPVGTLILDISSPSAGRIVWRGTARHEVDLDTWNSERQKVLERAVRDLIEKFPPKK
jgi:hypothetical protein